MEWRDYFAGTWALERRIDDKRGVMSGDLRGRAVFTPEQADARTLCLAEDGRYETAHGAFEARQTTIWRFSEHGPIDLRFANGRFFCRFIFAEGRATATHLCGDDRYEGSATILGANSWRLTWRVCGPRKDYTSTSWHRRNGDAPQTRGAGDAHEARRA